MNELEEETAIDIDRRVAKLLQELGVSEPPLDLGAVASFLHVDQGYYNLADPSLIREFEHKLRVGAHNVASLFQKIDLRGLWLPDRNQILIDQGLAEARQRWATAHELCHGFLPTHRPFFLGDTAETLDPEYHEMLEQEANFCTQRLLFLGTRFDDDARSLPVCLASVMEMKKRYANSIASTLRRYVGAMHDQLVVGIISQAKWNHPELSAAQRCRYMFKSKIFDRSFENVSGPTLVHAIDGYVVQRRGGPVGTHVVPVANKSGYGFGFKSESFFNCHDILTLMVADI